MVSRGICAVSRIGRGETAACLRSANPARQEQTPALIARALCHPLVGRRQFTCRWIFSSRRALGWKPMIVSTGLPSL